MADRNQTLNESTATSSDVLVTKVDPTTARFEANMRFMADLMSQVRNEGEKICEGGGSKAVDSQHSKGRLTARERIDLLVDPGTFFELGLYTAYGMYEEWGGAPAGGVITGLARIHTRMVMIIANDATVKAGAFFPMTSKKVIRAQNIAIENRIPTIYLVDSAGVFLPLQEDVFPDTDDFGLVPRWCRRRSGRKSQRKNWAAQPCILPSAGPSTSTNRMIRPALQESGPLLKSGAIAGSLHGTAKSRWTQCWLRRKFMAFTIHLRRVPTT